MTRFRFDDISVNTDMELTNKMKDYLYENIPLCEVIYCISPIVFDMSNEESQERRESLFPQILHAHSDYREFYKAELCGIPEIPSDVTTAGHALIHTDHRLLPAAAQEMSIITSCSLAKSNIFCPPFNKWNKITQEICDEHGIELLKFEDGWRSMEHNIYDSNQELYYCHTRAFNMKTWRMWFEEKELHAKKIW